MTQRIHTIFGAGQVGTQLAEELIARGVAVRIARRGPAGAARPGLTWLRGDIGDRAFMDAACRGAEVVYNCANPARYDRWAELLPPLFTSVREAAARSGARLVVLDNLYMYGMRSAAPFDEDTPMAPCSEKGALRKRLAEELFEAHARGEVQVTTGRASDYFGPSTVNAAVFHPRALRRLAAGKPIEMTGDPDQPHSYSYTPDVARGLAVLGTSEGSWGKVWHLPTAWHGTTRELCDLIARELGAPAARVRRIPNWALRGLGVFVPLLAALAEMSYQWEAPFVLDDRRFREAFGVGPTPIDVAVRRTIEATLPATGARAGSVARSVA